MIPDKLFQRPHENHSVPSHGRRHIHRRGEAAPHLPPRPLGEVRLQHGPERQALLRPREDQLHAETPRGATVRAGDFVDGDSGDVCRDPLRSQSIRIPPYIISALKYLSMVPDLEITPERVCFPLSRDTLLCRSTTANLCDIVSNSYFIRA